MYALHRPELFSSACPLSAYVGPLSIDNFKMQLERMQIKITDESKIQSYFENHNALDLRLCSESARATAAPIPLLAPVTNATLSSRCFMASRRCCRGFKPVELRRQRPSIGAFVEPLDDRRSQLPVRRLVEQLCDCRSYAGAVVSWQWEVEVRPFAGW